jgi:hypothetical protein
VDIKIEFSCYRRTTFTFGFIITALARRLEVKVLFKQNDIILKRSPNTRRPFFLIQKRMGNFINVEKLKL